MFKVGVVPPQADVIDLHTSDIKYEESKDIFVFVDTSGRLLVKNREWASLITVHVPALPRCVLD